MQHPHAPFCMLTIAGTDPSGAAGVQVDLQVARDLGFHGLSVVTAVVAQNTSCVRSFFALPAESVSAQLAAVFEDMRVDAIKIGMIPNVAIAQCVRDALQEYASGTPVVFDPVWMSGTGALILGEEGAFERVCALLAPLSSVVTPNSVEAARLLGVAQVQDVEGLCVLGQALCDKYFCKAVLLKSGHIVQDASTISDVFVDSSGGFLLQPFAKIKDLDVRGTGCQLSTALACMLVQDTTVVDAVEHARFYLNDLLAHKCCVLGKGRSIVVRVAL